MSMRISRVYLPEDLRVDTRIDLDKANSHYLNQVLRLKTGAEIILFNGVDGLNYNATILTGGKLVNVSIHSCYDPKTESSLTTTIFQGLGRSDHNDWMLQKVTELGAQNIVFFNARHTQIPLKTSAIEKKLAHWRAITISACQQSGRSLIPTVVFFKDLGSALKSTNTKLGLLLDFDGESLPVLSQTHRQKYQEVEKVSILLGPEGGLDPDEIDLAKGQSFELVTLGPRVLRMETAAVCALSLVHAYYGNSK